MASAMATTSNKLANTDMIPVIGAVICQELGIDTDEVEVDTDLRESGLNSLSALMITVKLLEEHNIDLGPGTLKENYSLCMLREALHRKGLAAKTARKELPAGKRVSFVETAQLLEETSSSDTKPSLTTSSPEIATVPDTSASQPESLVSRVMDIVAEEMDIAETEFVDTMEWANLGLDSIMSLAICGRLREELDMEVESTIFAEYDSVGAFKKHLADSYPSS